MLRLELKFQQQNTLWTDELRSAEQKLNEVVVTDEDIKLLSGETTLKSLSELGSGKKDILIERLKEALEKSSMTQEDVCNLLNNDLYEREKMAY